MVALRVHLDDSTRENGPLHVIPGSHANGVLGDRDIVNYVATQEAVHCLTQRGGVIAMRPLLLHSSSKARSFESRRVLHIEYADSIELSAIFIWPWFSRTGASAGGRRTGATLGA